MFQIIQDPITNKNIYRIGEKNFFGTAGTLIPAGTSAVSNSILNLMGMIVPALYVSWDFPTACTLISGNLLLLNESGNTLISQPLVSGGPVDPSVLPYGTIFDIFSGIPNLTNDNIKFQINNDDLLSDITVYAYLKGIDSFGQNERF